MARRPLTPAERDALNARQRDRYQNDPAHAERMKANAAKRYAEKRELIRQQQNEKYATDPEHRQRHIDASTRWIKEHPEKHNAISRAYHARKRKEAKGVNEETEPPQSS